MILGAGGSARAVGTALATSGCARLVVANRTAARGERLASLEPCRLHPADVDLDLGAELNRLQPGRTRRGVVAAFPRAPRCQAERGNAGDQRPARRPARTSGRHQEKRPPFGP
ncbi:MAG TPA: hypothetical protein VFD71_19625 [Planctomycetota bacterium]|nr:hypothetical protein [Planctomycetota bacterium]